MTGIQINGIQKIVILFLWVCLFTPLALAQETPVDTPINLNIATVEDLAKISLISQELAEAIVEYRDEVGDFLHIEELLQVEGFSQELFEAVKPFLLLDSIGEDDCSC